MENLKFTDRPWEKEYLVADANLRSVFSRHTDVADAKASRDIWRQAYPDMHVVIFERTSLTTWEGRFIAQEVTIGPESKIPVRS